MSGGGYDLLSSRAVEVPELRVGVDTNRARHVDHFDFALRFATHFKAMVLYGDTEPPGLWTVILPDGTRLLAALDETDDRFTLTSATVAIPDLPEVTTDVRGSADGLPPAYR